MLARELATVREQGFAVDREEFDEDFCCIAAPVLDDRGRLAGVLGLSASTRAFDAEHDELADAVRDVAAATVATRFQHRAETHDFLAGPRNGDVGSGRSRGTQSEVTT